MWSVHADHLDRPVRMTDGGQVVVWDAVYGPFGQHFVDHRKRIEQPALSRTVFPSGKRAALQLVPARSDEMAPLWNRFDPGREIDVRGFVDDEFFPGELSWVVLLLVSQLACECTRLSFKNANR